MEFRKIPFSPPDLGEAEYAEVIDALKSGWITTGPKTKELERQIADFLGTNRAVCLNSATSCMELVLRFLGVGEGDEVIVPAYTYTASASPACHCGADVVLVDSQEGEYEMDYDQMADAITEKTKVIVPVDIAGKLCDYDKIYEIVESKRHLFHPENEIQKKFGRIIVVTDCAHGFGATKGGKSAGLWTDFATYSFHAVKNFTTAEGGALTWRPTDFLDDEETYHWFMLYSLHGQTKDALSKTKAGSWEYDIVYPAYKCNMTDVHAALGLAQMKRYDKMLERRREIVRRYDEAFLPLGVKTVHHLEEGQCSSCHLYLMRIDGFDEKMRNELIIRLAKRGVATNVHYKPLPLLTAYHNMGYDIKDFPNAYNQYHNEVTLPLHTCLSDEDVEYIIEVVTEEIQKMKEEMEK